MKYLGIEFDLKNIPALDPEFIPFGVWMDAYLKDAKMPIAIAVEREKGQISSTAQKKWLTPITAMWSGI